MANNDNIQQREMVRQHTQYNMNGKCDCMTMFSIIQGHNDSWETLGEWELGINLTV